MVWRKQNEHKYFSAVPGVLLPPGEQCATTPEEAEELARHWWAQFSEEGSLDMGSMGDLLDFVPSYEWTRMTLSQEDFLNAFQVLPSTAAGPDHRTYRAYLPLKTQLAHLSVMVQKGFKLGHNIPSSWMESVLLLVPQELGCESACVPSVSRIFWARYMLGLFVCASMRLWHPASTRANMLRSQACRVRGCVQCLLTVVALEDVCTISLTFSLPLVHSSSGAALFRLQ